MSGDQASAENQIENVPAHQEDAFLAENLDYEY